MQRFFRMHSIFADALGIVLPLGARLVLATEVVLALAPGLVLEAAGLAIGATFLRLAPAIALLIVTVIGRALGLAAMVAVGAVLVAAAIVTAVAGIILVTTLSATALLVPTAFVARFARIPAAR